MADGRGGARKGAGRPMETSNLRAQEFRKALAEKIALESDQWLEAIKASALGHYAVINGTKIYKKSPDASAWEKAMDRAFGKPKQEIDVVETPDEETQERLEGMEEEIERIGQEYNKKILEKLTEKK